MIAAGVLAEWCRRAEGSGRDDRRRAAGGGARLRRAAAGGATVSGAAAAWASGELPGYLLRRADDALYAAKHSGGDAVTMGDSAKSIVDASAVWHKDERDHD